MAETLSPSSNPAEFPQKDHASRFVQEGKVGKGCFGVVYKAEDSQTKRTVALKLLRVNLSDKKAMASIRSEIHLLASCRNPHLTEIVDFGIMPSQAIIWVIFDHSLFILFYFILYYYVFYYYMQYFSTGAHIERGPRWTDRAGVLR